MRRLLVWLALMAGALTCETVPGPCPLTPARHRVLTGGEDDDARK
ncbi:hypothetical protein [Massilia niastensis]|nr:hypothetical protein [Massilia niastensis]